MSFWNWFQQNGDRVFAFFSLLSIALKSVDNLSPQASQAILIVGIVATVAHQAFFPNQPAAAPPAEQK
jgi:hypothetical protein